ncbi:Dabb family protein [Paraburkholderia bannensis]|uniref:Dabb family protein n=1 Tax=Paraburkholderia bannensis TaxID=765414 RepID=UPI002AB6E6C8|nr:Dabb family protein [Paraburkholderia bannensis]
MNEKTVKHIVMWDVRGETEQEKEHSARKVKEKFEALAQKIPGLLSIEVGIDFSKESYAHDVVLYSVFSSTQALKDYQQHPAHLRVREELEGVRTARHQVDFI